MTLYDELSRLTDNQPAQPGERLDAVTRKAVRIRRRRAAVSVAAVVALAAPVGVLALAHQPPSRSARFTTSPVASWPDRSVAKDRAVADGALGSYRALHGEDQLGKDVHWLFRGAIPLPDHDDAYVSMFVIRRNAADVVVSAQNRRSQVDGAGKDVNNQPNSIPWAFHEQPVKKGLDHLGVYLEYMDSGQRNANYLLVVGDPTARHLDVTRNPLPFAPDLGTPTGASSASSANGLFVQDVGRLTGPLTMSLTDDRGNRGGETDLSSTLSEPGLLQPDTVNLPAGFVSDIGGTGQSERQDNGRYDGPLSVGGTRQGKGQAVVVEARCYGGGRVTFDLRGARERSLARGGVVCDGQSHEALRTTAPVADPSYRVDTSVTTLVALTFQVGTVPAR